MAKFFDYKGIVDAIKRNSIVFFLGAGVNLPVDGPCWDPKNPTRPPSGQELATHMAQDFIADVPDLAKKDLQHVATYYEIARRSAGLYTCLHDIFNVDYPAQKIHSFLAELPSLVRAAGCASVEYPLIVTTNYDDILERALGDQPRAVYTYIEHGSDRGKFRLCNDNNVIKEPNKLGLANLRLKERYVIFKVHGTITRSAESLDLAKDEYVITEDHYIDYLASAPIAQVVPMGLVTALKERSILFLGYALQDWHLRVLLRRIIQGQPLETSRWSVQLKADEVYRAYSEGQHIALIEEPLDLFVDKLRKELVDTAASKRKSA